MAGPTKQVVLDFQKMTKSGLLPLAKKFQRYKLEVSDIEATNKPKRDSGQQIKEATFIFSTGQKLLVKVKNDGTVFQVKLNNKVLPIKHVDDMDKAIIEIVDHIDANAKTYLKAQERRAAKAATGEVGKHPVRTSRAEQIDKFTARVTELQAEQENMQASNGKASGELEQLIATLEDLQAELAELQARGEELETELESLKEAA